MYELVVASSIRQNQNPISTAMNMTRTGNAYKKFLFLAIIRTFLH
jgi:hypothetical protein